MNEHGQDYDKTMNMVLTLFYNAEALEPTCISKILMHQSLLSLSAFYNRWRSLLSLFKTWYVYWLPVLQIKKEIKHSRIRVTSKVTHQDFLYKSYIMQNCQNRFFYFWNDYDNHIHMIVFVFSIPVCSQENFLIHYEGCRFDK